MIPAWKRMMMLLIRPFLSKKYKDDYKIKAKLELNRICDDVDEYWPFTCPRCGNHYRPILDGCEGCCHSNLPGKEFHELHELIFKYQTRNSNLFHKRTITVALSLLGITGLYLFFALIHFLILHGG